MNISRAHTGLDHQRGQPNSVSRCAVARHQLCSTSGRSCQPHHRVRHSPLPPHPRRRGLACYARLPRRQIENPELLVGDCVALVTFAFYKQISSIILSPDFPGWLAPLKFNPVRFAEFLSLTLSLCGTWVAAGLIFDGYRTEATQNLPTTLAKTSKMWLASMPVVAAQLVLVTAMESRALVGDEGFASVLPTAASGAGEPFVSASGVLGLMAVWRSFYCLYLDIWGLKGLGFQRQQFMDETLRFREALLLVALMAAASTVSLQVMQAWGRYMDTS